MNGKGSKSRALLWRFFYLLGARGVKEVFQAAFFIYLARQRFIAN